MTKETDAMQNRIMEWLPQAKKRVKAMNAKIDTLSGTAKKTIAKHRDELQHQIHMIERELDEPNTDAFTENSLGTSEMGRLG